MASQDTRLFKFEADFKQQHGEMTNKIDTILKAINDRIIGALPSDTVKNPKLNVNSTSPILSARSYPKKTLNAHPIPSIRSMLSKHVPRKQTIHKRTNCKWLAGGTKSYPVGIVKNVEVHIGRLKLLDDVYVIDMEKDPATPLLIGRGFLATANAVIDCRKAKIAVGEGITMSIFGVKEISQGNEEMPYWTTLGKRESYKPRPSTDSVGKKTPFYVKKNFVEHHLPWEWQLARDTMLNPFKDVLVFRKMIEFLGAIPINLKGNKESEELIKKKIDWN
ncbi:MAK10-like protein [Tanacetum coccineum]